jgi:uncharacterized membrane protein (DUF2068 family)
MYRRNRGGLSRGLTYLQMIETPVKSSARKKHNRWLVLIALFKLGQALLFIAIGVGALRLVGKDLGDALYNLADRLRFNPESRLVNFVLEKAALVDDRMLRRLSAAFFLYAGLGLTEGIGLYLEKMWAEYFTLGLTASFLPWEVYEVIRRHTWLRFGLLTINVLVLLYLAKVIWERKRPNLKKN